VAGSSYHAHMILVYKHEEQAWNSAPANSIWKVSQNLVPIIIEG
jgi:hypothetical protein